MNNFKPWDHTFYFHVLTHSIMKIYVGYDFRVSLSWLFMTEWANFSDCSVSKWQ